MSKGFLHKMLGWLKTSSRKGKLILFLFAAFLCWLIFTPMPSFEANTPYSTVLEAKDGTLLGARIAGDGQWRFPLQDSVPPKFEKSLLLFEDEFFYSHPGVNPVAIFKAVLQNVREGKVVRGGSTLSMQLVRLARGNKSRTVGEKVLEILMALKMELWYSKDEILQLYTAHAPFGGNVVGLPAASWRYYGRPADQLSWAESATLAVLPNSPSLIYPGKNSFFLKEKRNRLLGKLFANGVLDTSIYQLSLAEPLPGKPKPLPDFARHLLNRSIKEGKAEQVVRSTLDPRLQQKVLEKVQRAHEDMKARHVYNAAALVVEIKSGKALAYVGNTDTEGEHGQYVDIITSNRSTGSLLKPILYAAALDEGILLPRQLLPDIPVFLQGFAPQNFDKKFHGAVPADQALARSLNVPFVFLLKEYGYEKFHQKLKDLGISSLHRPANHYGLSLILGGAESSLWDITATYAGMVRSLQLTTKRVAGKKYSDNDYFPNTYIAQKRAQEVVITEKGKIGVTPIHLMLEAMKELVRPEEQAGWESYSSASPIAWKTGTSYGFKDAWAIGITAEHVVGVWLGNADGEGRPDLTGIKAAAPLMFSIMEELPQNQAFPKPYNSGSLEVCSVSGFKAGPNCEKKQKLKLPQVSEKALSCPYHQLLHLNEEETNQVSSACYPVDKIRHKSWFVLPAGEALYYRQYNSNYVEPPNFLSQCVDKSGASERVMDLIYPRQYTKIYVPTELDGSPGSAVFEVAHRQSGASIYWHLDEEYLGKTTNRHQMGLQPPKGKHTLFLLDEQGRELKLAFEVISERRK